MATATTKNVETVETLELPATLYGKLTRKGLTLREEKPEGATKIWRQLTKDETNAVYDVIEKGSAEATPEGKYDYLLEKLAEGKAAKFGNRAGKPHGLLKVAAKAGGFKGL